MDLETKSSTNLRVSEECDSTSNQFLPVCHVHCDVGRELWVDLGLYTVTLTFAFALTLFATLILSL